MVNYLGGRALKLNEVKVGEVQFVEVVPEVITKDYVNHHILTADLSGSMSGNVRILKERIKTTLEALCKIPNSYVSVLTYSGHSQSKIIVNAVKCDEISYKMAKVYETIESEFYIKGVTVMSEPLEDAIVICKDLAKIADRHHIALFTDGCLVPTRWSESTEESKCCAIAEICKKQGIFKCDRLWSIL
jgi:hypothetical protein